MSDVWVPVGTAVVAALAALSGVWLQARLSDRAVRRQVLVNAVAVLTSYTSQAELTRGVFDLLDANAEENLRWRADLDLKRMHELHQAVAALEVLGSDELSRKAQELYVCISERSGDWDDAEVVGAVEKANRELLRQARDLFRA